jgi:hypothetical protein
MANANTTQKNMRTNIKTLQYLVNQINTLTNSPATPYTRQGDKMEANIGNYHLSQAYGGVCVHRMANESGGCTTPIWSGHGTKKEAEMKLRAFICGLQVKN